MKRQVGAAESRTTRLKRYGRPEIFVVALMLLLQLPLVWIGGPGNDWDGPRVIRSAVLMIEEHTYQRSRGPGHPAHEVGTAILYWAGGQLLANLGTVGMSVVSILSFLSIARHYRVPSPELLSLLVILNPWFWTYSTYSVDMVWAFGFLMAGYALLLKRRFVLSGLLFGLAVGCRPPSVLFVLPILGEAFLNRDPVSELRSRLITIGTMGVIGALSYVPPFVESGYSLSFLRDYNTGGYGLQEIIPRFVYKNIYLWGLPLSVALTVFFSLRAKIIYRQLMSIENRSAVLVALLAIFAMECLFFRFPQKTAYLIPMLPFVAMLVGMTLRSASRRYRQTVLVGIICLQLTYAVVNFNIAIPDVPGRATTAEIGFFVEPGFLLRDVDARVKGVR